MTDIDTVQSPQIPDTTPARRRTRTDLVCRAALYVRMSTDHQHYSTANQRDALARYAADHGLDVVRTYADEGKSGLTAEGRDGLCALLGDVVGGRADFNVVLVYDVSRWGRFQDADESAYYEFLCRRSGIRIEYCMEQFRNDGTPMSAVMKGLKRVMAGEYSRDLGERVHRGKMRMFRRGYRQGGAAGYGFRRMLVDSENRPIQVLEEGQHKCLQEQHIVLVPGPKEEIKIVNWIFREVARGRTFASVAARLNARGIPCVGGRAWSGSRIQGIIRNEKYIGTDIYCKTRSRLRSRLVKNPPEQWIRIENAVPALVSPKLFQQAQRPTSSRFRGLPPDKALDILRALLKKHGTLNSRIMNSAHNCPGHDYFQNHFGGVLGAYQAIGFKTYRNYSYLCGYTNRYRRAAAFRDEVMEQLKERGASVLYDSRTVLRINRRFRVTVKLCPCRVEESGQVWGVQHHVRPIPHWMLAARLDPQNSDMLDYSLIESPPQVVMLPVQRHRTRISRYRIASRELGPLLDILAGLGRGGDLQALTALLDSTPAGTLEAACDPESVSEDAREFLAGMLSVPEEVTPGLVLPRDD